MVSTSLIMLFSLTSAFATPVKQVNLDDIQCRCLTFSTSAAPTHCVYQELLTLDWETAHSLAVANNLKIQFVSDKAITKVLSIPSPLPTAVLDAVHEGKTLPLDPSKETRNENRLICGFGNDLDRVESQSAGLKPEIHYVGTVLGLFMLFFVVYLVAEYIWIRYTTRPKRIMLEGDEKVLTADLSHDSSNDDEATAINKICQRTTASNHRPTQTQTQTPAPIQDIGSTEWPLMLCGSWGPTQLALSHHYHQHQHHRASALPSMKKSIV